MELKDMIEKIGRAFEEFKSENDARLKAMETKGHADPVLVEKVEKINADMSALSAMKRQLETIETSLARRQMGGGNSESDSAKAQHRTGFKNWMRKGIDAGLKDMEVKAELSTLSDPDGGFTVPEELSRTIRDIASTKSAMRRLADVITVGVSEYKELVDKQGETASWVGEKDTRAETDTPTLAQVSWFTKELYTMPPVTQTMLDDSWFDVEGWVAKFSGRAFGVKQGAAWITGNGVEKPKGIAAGTMITNASYAWGKVGYVPGGHASLMNNVDKLIDLQHALKIDYRTGAYWLTNDTTLGTIRKFKDGDGNYIWRPGLIEGAPDILLGKPVEIDDNVDDIGANKYPIFFGNFKDAYLIIDRMGVRMLRDPYTKKGYVLFYTTMRTGGGIRNYEALKAMKIATA